MEFERLDDQGDDWIEVCPRLYIRQYGESVHYQLRSEQAGSDGDIVLHVDDLEKLGQVLLGIVSKLAQPQPPEESIEDVELPEEISLDEGVFDLRAVKGGADSKEDSVE